MKEMDSPSRQTKSKPWILLGLVAIVIVIFGTGAAIAYFETAEELDAERAARINAEGVAAAEAVARKEAERLAALEADARKTAELKAEQELQVRKLAEETAAREEEARKVAEETAAREEEARRVAEERAVTEAIKRAEEGAARKAAERAAAQERVAKEQQQREADFQRSIAEENVKARVLELARTNPYTKAAVTGELRFYIDPLPYYTGEGVSSAVEAISESFSSWTPFGATVRRVYNINQADLTISWVRDYGAQTIGESIGRVHIKVGLGTNNCLGDWRAFDAETVQKILWHELGHSMGYDHSSNPDNIMYYKTATRFVVEQEVSEVIAGGWSYAPRLCEEGAYSYWFKSDNRYIGFDLFVLLPGVDPISISAGGGRIYVGCGKENMVSYSGSCNVASGAKIYVSNNSFSSAIRLSGQIINDSRPAWPDMTWDNSAFQYDIAELTKYQELFR